MNDKVRQIRKARGLSQTALAHATGSAPSWLSYIEAYGHIPGPDLRQRIAQALGATEHELWPDLQIDGSTDVAEAEDDAGAA